MRIWISFIYDGSEEMFSRTQGIEAFAHLDPFLLAVALTYGSRACNNLHWTETDLGRFSQERDSFVLVKRHRIVQNFDDVHMCSQVNAPVSQDLE